MAEPTDTAKQALARVEEIRQQFASLTDEQIPYVVVVLEMSTSARYLSDLAKVGADPERLMAAAADLNAAADELLTLAPGFQSGDPR